MVLRVVSFSTFDLLLESVELRAHLGRGEAQPSELSWAALRVVEARAEATGGQGHQLEVAEDLERSGPGWGLLLLGAGTQEKPWGLEQTLLYRS